MCLLDWVENYERICAYKRLFGVVALSPDKLCSFEKLEQVRFRFALPGSSGF